LLLGSRFLCATKVTNLDDAVREPWDEPEPKSPTLTTMSENHGMNPNLFRYAAMAMSAANHVSVSHAGPLARHSFQVMTLVTRRMVRPTVAAATALTPMEPPKIHRPTVSANAPRKERDLGGEGDGQGTKGADGQRGGASQGEAGGI